MTAEKLDVAIIGAGTAGLSARSEVAKVTDNYRVFDPGPYGTTCARSACMPSKAFIQSAHDFHRRHDFTALGIDGADRLTIDTARVLAEVRHIRNGLVDSVIDGMQSWRNTHLVPERASFEEDGTLCAGEARFRPQATVIATGSRPMIPDGWHEILGDRLLTSDDLFELPDLPKRIAVVGLGPVGLELGQSLARLGVEVTGFDPNPTIGGLQDPELLHRLRDGLDLEMTILGVAAEPVERNETGVTLRWDGGETVVDHVLVAMGRTPNLKGLGLDALGVDAGENGFENFPDGRLNLPDTRLYFAGDSGPGPAILHEASDEGRIAGYFAARNEDAVFRRRTPLRMVFCDPQIAIAGDTWDTLEARQDEIAIGEATFNGAGRTRLQRADGGALRIYAEQATGRLLGAAIVAPEAEHIAHFLAYAITRKDDLSGLLRAPVYHPTHEEVLRRALRTTLAQCDVDTAELEAIRCADAPVDHDMNRG